MGRKRKANGNIKNTQPSKTAKYDIEERFDDSEDEFYASRDKVLLDNGPDASRRKRLEEQEKDLEQSDEEILDYASGSEEDAFEQEEEDEADSDIGENEEHDTETSEEEVWGTNKADYYSADVLETEADALEEEAEARRLQQKQLKGMSEADFGIDSTWIEAPEAKFQKRSRTEKLPEIQIPEKATNEERKKMLFSRYPEAQLLGQDFEELQAVENEFRQSLMEEKAVWKSDSQYGPGISVRTKLQAVSAYLACITLYFGVLASKANAEKTNRTVTALNPVELREHPIIEALMTSKKIWDEVKIMPTAEILVQKPKLIDVEPIVNGDKSYITVEEKRVSKPKKIKNTVLEKPTVVKKPKEKKPKYTSVQDLLKTSTNEEDDDLSQLGDEQPLTQQEVEEKAKKRKSLRFYTSQMAQKANKRGAASRGAGGDDDVPHKERIRDRQERLLKEAEARGRSQLNEEEQLDDAESVGDDAHDADDYYQTLVAHSNKKKTAKQARADAYAEAARLGGQVYEEATIGADGKRAITYAIEKNKGLTPKRSKDVRNPRVKKRKKYDEKMKKLGSIRQVYKGGEGRGGYGGELTGIKANIVRGVRL